MQEKKEKKTKKSNGKSLVIVESPAKTKTIKKILGDEYNIEASYGHIRDFPPKVLGFDVTDINTHIKLLFNKFDITKWT